MEGIGAHDEHVEEAHPQVGQQHHDLCSGGAAPVDVQVQYLIDRPVVAIVKICRTDQVFAC